MKRRFGGIVLALTLVLGSAGAGAASANIVWATLADQQCTQSKWDIWMYANDPYWFGYYEDLISQDVEAWLMFRAMGGDANALYHMFQIAPDYAPCH